jgi:hypothetical protein
VAARPMEAESGPRAGRRHEVGAAGGGVVHVTLTVKSNRSFRIGLYDRGAGATRGIGQVCVARWA